MESGDLGRDLVEPPCLDRLDGFLHLHADDDGTMNGDKAFGVFDTVGL